MIFIWKSSRINHHIFIWKSTLVFIWKSSSIFSFENEARFSFENQATFKMKPDFHLKIKLHLKMKLGFHLKIKLHFNLKLYIVLKHIYLHYFLLSNRIKLSKYKNIYFFITNVMKNIYIFVLNKIVNLNSKSKSLLYTITKQISRIQTYCKASNTPLNTPYE